MLRTAPLLLALAGYWLPWLSLPAAALKLNGYELSEWITFLPGLRDGSLNLSRLQFLFPLACLAVLCGLLAVKPRPQVEVPLGLRPRPSTPRPGGLGVWLPSVAGVGGWALVALGLLCAFVVLPPYPYILTALGDPEYRLQLVVGVLALAGVVLALYLPYTLNCFLQLVVPLAGLWAAVPALLRLRPAAQEVLNAPWPLGWGLPLLAAGLLWVAWAGLRRLFAPRP